MRSKDMTAGITFHCCCCCCVGGGSEAAAVLQEGAQVAAVAAAPESVNPLLLTMLLALDLRLLLVLVLVQVAQHIPCKKQLLPGACVTTSTHDNSPCWPGSM